MFQIQPVTQECYNIPWIDVNKRYKQKNDHIKFEKQEWNSESKI